MQQYRCTKCKKLLLEGAFKGLVKKICEKCKNINIFTEIESQPTNAMQHFTKSNEETAINPHSIYKP